MTLNNLTPSSGIKSIYWKKLIGTKSSSPQSSEIFRDVLKLDNDTWDRARGWVLWKTLCAPIAGTDCDKIFNEIADDFEIERK